MPKQEHNTEDSLRTTKYQLLWSGVFLLLGVYKMNIFQALCLKSLCSFS
jgi:hypothetical protein